MSRWDDSFWDDVSRLPDLIAEAAEQGLPIRVPDPGTEHGRRLLQALGAEFTVEMTGTEYLELVERAERATA